jgi:hypothetical protein
MSVITKMTVAAVSALGAAMFLAVPATAEPGRQPVRIRDQLLLPVYPDRA